jgi:N-methylhydantoinase A/oxoprolinase/acetone carboxylase beta subunit
MTAATESARIAVDVGGTFTDLVSHDPGSGELRIEKVMTTADALAEGVLEALERCGTPVAAVGDFVHGTTVSTNAVIERATPPTAFVTTRGFRDTLEIMRGDRPMPVYDISWRKPEPLVPRRLRFEADERLDAQGRVVRPLDEGALRTLVRSPEFDSVAAVGVSFLHSFLDDRHERRAAEILAEERPELFVSLSADVDPEVREYERASTVVLDAMLKPLMNSYLWSLERRLRDFGLSSEVHVMLANAGVLPIEGATARPILTLHSGPAGGVVGTKLLGQELRRANLIAADMGGTSFDVCTIANGAARYRSEGMVTWGIPFRMPLVDIGTIGAGGGSIGWIDSGGLLRVGPMSAGSAPGPSAYGLGGTDATVTDACCVLGYLGDGGLAGGTVPLHRGNALAAVERLSRRLGDAAEGVADGIVRIAMSNMADEIRKNSVERGDDPRDFSLVSFGGAGAMFASVLARDLGMREVIVPPNAGVFSAYGMLGAERRVDVHRTFYGRVDEVDPREVARVFSELENRVLVSFADARDEVVLARELALRYVGQRHELRVPLAPGSVTPTTLREARDAFDRQHAVNYGHERPGDPVELRAAAVVATSERPRPALRNRGRKRAEDVLKERRRVRLAGEEDWLDVPVYERLGLATGILLQGPAIIEAGDSTIVIYPGQRASVHETGSVIVEGWR